MMIDISPERNGDRQVARERNRAINFPKKIGRQLCDGSFALQNCAHSPAGESGARHVGNFPQKIDGSVSL
jgi:hypothetical protein